METLRWRKGLPSWVLGACFGAGSGAAADSSTARKRRFARNFGNDFCSEGFADRATGVVDAALREGEGATAVAGFGIQALERGGFLLDGESGEIDVGKFGGTAGVLQEDLSGVFKHFDGGIDGQAEQRANFAFVYRSAVQADVFLYDFPVLIDHECGGQRGDAAVGGDNFARSHDDRIVKILGGGEFLHFLRGIVIQRDADDDEAVFVQIFQLDQHRNFGAAGRAPGGPEIQQDDFTFPVGGGDGLAVEIGSEEGGRVLGITGEADDARLVGWA